MRAIREADFSMYLKAIRELLSWMFALDSHNNVRWLSVHYRDMCDLPVKHPDVCAESHNGSFKVNKTKRLFSSIALDHAHEQVNAVVKGEGGTIELTENPAALRRWMVAGPELARIVEEFEEVISAKAKTIMKANQSSKVPLLKMLHPVVLFQRAWQSVPGGWTGSHSPSNKRHHE